MAQDKEFYAFIVAPSAKSKLRKVRISYKLIRTSLIVVGALAILGLVGLARMITHAAIEVQLASVRSENEQLKRENDGLRTNYDRLYNRVTVTTDAAETLKRQIEGAPSPEVVVAAGQGGPDEVDNIDIPDLERRTDELEREIRQLVDTYRDQQLRIATVPSGWPTEGYLTDGFGYRHNPFGGGGSESHEGQDIASAWGTPVKSTADGLIVYAAARAGYGNVVVIYHGNGITTRYGHLSQIGVEPGQRIRRGDEIGKVGSTGRSTGPHCHYEVRQNDVALDPAKFVR
jgi:murein DD-endopeptidase MepM/ murein hydrolase activator NlpD